MVTFCSYLRVFNYKFFVNKLYDLFIHIPVNQVFNKKKGILSPFSIHLFAV